MLKTRLPKLLAALSLTLFAPTVFAQFNPLHGLIPSGDTDEAFNARKNGQMSQQEQNLLFKGSSEDYFQAMDYGVTLPQNHESLRALLDNYIPGITAVDAAERVVRGRNNWIVWTGGNDRFWNYMSRATLGGLDFLKTISDHPNLPSTRSDRWQYLGLVNEPCFIKAAGPRADRWGLWLPTRDPNCPADPFENADSYPGVRAGARGQTLKYKGQDKLLEVGSYYGYATGIVGLRLFTNPDFDQKAADRWDPVAFYTSQAYYYDPNLVRPYRVGMACAFCHVGPSPTNPPKDFNNPKWENLNSNPGAQYFWVDRIFYWDWKKDPAKENNFVGQLLKTSRPGSLDTSLVSSDMINNPRTMNAVYDLPARVAAAGRFNHVEQLKGDETLNAQFSKMPVGPDVPKESPLRGLYNTGNNQVLSPRVLKDGSDSVGALGALNREYLNIGLFSEEWVKHFIPLVGGPILTPIPIKAADANSLYWQANLTQTPDVALFFLAASRPDKLSQAPGGMKYLQDFNSPTVNQGKKVFARNCAGCHSSTLPPKAYTFFKKDDPMACAGKNYMSCWNSYWNYVKTPEFKDAMEKLVMDEHFLDSTYVNPKIPGNYLSTELRVPVSLTDSQLCSPIGTNAIDGNIWDNFSSSSYKTLSPAGKFRVNYPTANSAVTSKEIDIPDGGRGYLRPASLISVWSSAPFLQNNSLGKFDYHGTVDGRIASFNDSINKLLNPELRDQDAGVGKWAVPYTTNFGSQLKGVIDVTTGVSFIKIPRGYLSVRMWNLLKDLLDKEPGAKDMMGKGKSLTMVNGGEMKKVAFKAPEPKKHNWVQRQWFAVFGGAESTDLASNSDEDSANYAGDEMGEFIRLGPIPAGVPVNLLANINLDMLLSVKLGAGFITFSENMLKVVHALNKIKADKLTGEPARAAFMTMAADALVKVSRCNDFVVNRGHYFGTLYSPDKGDSGQGLSKEDKAALIEYLKWM